MGGRPHKGDRVLLQTRPYDAVVELVTDRQRAAGVSSLSQYVADVLAMHVSRNDLVVELDRIDGLPLDRANAEEPRVRAALRRTLVQTRPHRQVWTAVHQEQNASGVSSVSQYVADILAMHVDRHDLVVELGLKEGLPLAM